MTRTLFGAISAVLSLVGACSSNADPHLGAYDAGGASGGSAVGGTASRLPRTHAGSAAVSEDGGASDGGAAGLSNDAGAPGTDQGLVVPIAASACSKAAGWTAATPVAGVSTTDDEQLLAITADELDVVFLRGTFLFRAHRALASAAFDTASAVTIPDGYTASAGAALSADGKSLVLVASSGQGFAAVTRDSRGGDFGTTAEANAFTALNQRAIQTMEQYSHPVLSPDGKSFVFAAFTPALVGGKSVVYESSFSGGGWAMPANISDGIFDGTTDKKILPSSLSSDSRTLFYYDEASANEVARFRDRPDAPLYDFIDLGGRLNAVPNVSCDRIYYSANGNVLTEAK